MKNKDGEKGHILRFKVGILVLIVLSSVLFLSSNAEAIILINETFEDNTTNKWNIPNGNIFTQNKYKFNNNYGANVTGDLYYDVAPYINITSVNYPVINNISLKAWVYLSSSGYPNLRLTNLTALNRYTALIYISQMQIQKFDNDGFSDNVVNTSCSFVSSKWYLMEMNISRINYNDSINLFVRDNQSTMTCSLKYSTTANFTNSTLYIGLGNNCDVGQNCFDYYDDIVVEEFTLPLFSITAKDLFNQSISLTNFSADIDGSIYTTTTGTIETNINKSLGEAHNITIFSNENGGYFNKTYLNYSTSTNLIATIYQAEANATIFIKILNISAPLSAITNITIFTNPQQSTKNYTDRFYLRANQNITFRASGGYGYFIYTTINVPPFFNETIDLTGLYNQTLIVQLRDGNNNLVINSYNLTIFNTAYNYSENFNTTNGNVTIPILKNFNFNFTFIPTNVNYSILNTNFTTIDNSTNFKRFYTMTSNSINISIYNETSSTFITELINIRFTSDYMILDYSTATGKKYIENIPEGFYSVSFNAPSGNYAERIYYVSIFNRTTTSLNVYLPFVNVSVPIYIYLKTIDNNILEGGLITIQKQVNTSFVTIAQKYTDVTGLAVFNLINANTYKFIISAEGYTTREFELQVYYVNSPYNIKLEPEGYTPYTNAYQYVQYYYNPTSSIVTPQSVVNFSITTFSNESKLQYTYIDVNGSILNLTGSPSGATALISKDLTNYKGILPVTYGFKVQGFNAILFTINYYVNQNQGYDESDIYTTLTAVKTEVNNQGWTTLIAIFVAVVVAITITQLSGNPTISTIGAFIVLIFFLLIGWLPLTAVAFASVIGLLMMYLQRGGY